MRTVQLFAALLTARSVVCCSLIVCCRAANVNQQRLQIRPVQRIIIENQQDLNPYLLPVTRAGSQRTPIEREGEREGGWKREEE